MKSVKDRRNGEVYDLQYSRELDVDCDAEGEIRLPVHDSRPLHSIVSPSTLPTYTKCHYNPKKGTFTEKKVRANADETILRSAQHAQGRLGAHMVTGHEPEPKGAQGKNAQIGGMGLQPTPSWKGRGF